MTGINPRVARGLVRPELATLDNLDTGNRGGPEPGGVTLESFGRAVPEA